MYKIGNLITVILLFYSISNSGQAQITINSTRNYQVNINILPLEVVPQTNDCSNGFFYKIRLSCVVTLTGENPPSMLSVLNGSFVCGNQTLFFDLPNCAGTDTILTENAIYTSQTDCNSIDVHDMFCNNVSINISGFGISYRTVSIILTPLPVKFGNISVSKLDRSNLIEFTTFSEVNNDYFVIQKSFDGENFYEIGELNSRFYESNTNQIYYSFIDDSPSGQTDYYRIKQIDFDGLYSYSSIVSIQNNNFVTVKYFYPNPAHDSTSIELDYNQMIDFYNIQGMKIKSVQGVKGENKIDLIEIPQGIYFIKGANFESKLIKD